jgi:hypothetical protein
MYVSIASSSSARIGFKIYTEMMGWGRRRRRRGGGGGGGGGG